MANDVMSNRINAEILARYHLSVSPAWTSTHAPSRHPAPPFLALVQTVYFRLLQSDFTSSLLRTDPQSLLPSNVSSNPTPKEIVCLSYVPVQILDIADISTSNLAQVEAIERIERGEEVRGREVIRTLPAEATGPNDFNPGPETANLSRGSTGPHRLTLQDAAGRQIIAFESSRIVQFSICATTRANGSQEAPITPEGTPIGMKLLLKPGTVIQRGIVMLSPENVNVLGGKVETWDRSWREGRKQRLDSALDVRNRED